MKKPRSAYDLTHGIYYFARMLDKIRLQAEGLLPQDYQSNLGTGFDGRMCGYLHVTYEEVSTLVLAGCTDEEVWAWCETHGRTLNEVEVTVWNDYAIKRGWKDDASPMLVKYKEAAGLANRDDIQTAFDFYDADEGRKPHV